ncbi:fungal-specific transcription factor domain-containing protein [Ilyonectria destructans]|nr:fungal-specific transcription factor domain-containing protein [Ilyonectria destructans]
MGNNLRWEAAGLFLAATARAILDTPYFIPLYRAEDQRRSITRALTYIGDCCLEICWSLDRLSDLQLILQFESFIVHTLVDGDQSYHAWRKMGDLVSSLCALGYHQRIDETGSDTPPFITELRKASFARIYTLDKNFSIFMGRPPRLLMEFCFFPLPVNLVASWRGHVEPTANTDPSRLSTGDTPGRSSSEIEVIDHTAEIRCSALFAAQKEKILRILCQCPSVCPESVVVSRNFIDLSASRELGQKVEEQWYELPDHFRLATGLRDCHSDPFARDFLAGTRLDYLHTLLLMNLAIEPNISKVTQSALFIAAEMLSLIVEVIVLRDHLISSGTSLIWKVAQYGLPAAGVASMALSSYHQVFQANSISLSKLTQDLDVPIAEIRLGAWIQAGDPNFDLLTQATQTIQSLLDSVKIWRLGNSMPDERLWNLGSVPDPERNFPPWEFGMDFWTNLAYQLAFNQGGV